LENIGNGIIKIKTRCNQYYFAIELTLAEKIIWLLKKEQINSSIVAVDSLNK